MDHTVRYNREELFLATTALEDYWDTSKHLLYLGEWCRRYHRKSFWEHLSGEVLRNPWDDPERLNQANRYIVDVYEKLLPLLGEALNDIHGVRHSSRFWRIIVGPWLQYYIPVVYDKYVCLKSVFDKYPDITSSVLSEEAWVTPSDTLEFVQLIKDDPYNLQLYSRIMKILGKDFQSKSAPVTASPFITGGQHLPRGLRGPVEIVLRYMQKLINLFQSGHLIVLRNSYFPFLIELKLMVKTFGAVWPIYGEPRYIPPMETNGAVRSRLNDALPATNEFEAILNKMLFADIPRSYVEGFGAIQRASTRFYPAKPKAIFSSAAWYFDEPFKQWAADCAEKGTLLLGMQHGGYYGSLRFFPNEDHELAITDNFYSWGWDHPTRPHKITPSSAAKMSDRKSLDADNWKTGILFIASMWSRYLMQMPYPPMHFYDYLSWQVRFVKTMTSRLLPKMRVRFHREDFGWDIAERWKDICPQVASENWDTTFIESLDNCRICVVDHQGTTFLEALAADKPSILFWNPAIAEPRPEAKPYYDQLRGVGILFDTPEAAADAANKVYDDVETWWNDPERQHARSEFCRRFARTSPNALNEWMREFARIAKEGTSDRKDSR